jgi:hypothetical protein
MNLRQLETKITDGKKLNAEEEAYLVEKANVLWDDHPDVAVRFPRWKKILAWVAGYQYYDYAKGSKTLAPVQIKRKRKLVFNRMRSFARTMLAKLTQTSANLGVVPNTDEYEDTQAADVGDKVLEFLSDKLHFQSLRRTFSAWFILTNKAYLRVFWNSEDSGIVARQANPVLDDGGQPVGERFNTITEPGDIGMEVLSPFNCRVDPLNFDRNKWRWFMYGEEVEADALEEEYGLEEGSLNEKSNVHDTMLSLDNSGDEDFQFSQSADNEKITGKLVIKKHFWTPKMYVITAADKVLESRENTYGEIPVFTYEDRLVPINHYEKGVVYNDGALKDLVPVQRAYNRYQSIVSQAIQRASQVRILGGFDGMVNKEHVLDQSGTIFIDYNMNAGRPEQLRMDAMPPWAIQHGMGLERELEMVGGVHEASFGRLPNRASHASGALVNVLLEQDDQTFDPIITDMDAVFSDAWSLALRIVQEKYTVGRLIKVCGKNSIEGAVKFRGSDLRGNTDVKVSSQTGLPRSRALRIDYVQKLWEANILTDPKTVLELIELGEVKKLFSDSLLHEKRAMRENALIENDPNIDPASTLAWIYDLDDNLAHLKFHLRDRLSPKFDSYTPNQQQALDGHIKATVAKLQPPPPASTPQPTAQEPAAPTP